MTTWMTQYLGARYVNGGRGANGWDCWGLVREVRQKHLGLPELAEFGGVVRGMPKTITRAYKLQSDQMEECEPEEGAIACVFRGPLCIHVAVVIEVGGKLGVLEMSPQTHCRWLPLSRWKADHVRVAFYRDRK